MMDIVSNFQKISNNINLVNKNITIIAVSKTFKIEQIMPLINFGHKHFGENKVQESLEKWMPEFLNEKKIQLHMLGKLQSNKVDDAVRIFSYVHSLDNDKLALKLSAAEKKINKSLIYFIQVNIASEPQKSGIAINYTDDFIKFCVNDLKLNVRGLMCLPPINADPAPYFQKLNLIGKKNNLKDLSMGMSQDYIQAINFGATYVRIGSNIFGERS
jgi:pyridoxal phosphate enzyme (YggS family)